MELATLESLILSRLKNLILSRGFELTPGGCRTGRAGDTELAALETEALGTLAGGSSSRRYSRELDTLETIERLILSRLRNLVLSRGFDTLAWVRAHAGGCRTRRALVSIKTKELHTLARVRAHAGRQGGFRTWMVDHMEFESGDVLEGDALEA